MGSCFTNRGKGAVDIETVLIQKTVKTSVFHAERARPLTNRAQFSIEFHPMILPGLVVHLIDSCRPAAILWRVGTVIINAINAVVATWPASHIAKEISVRALPAFAHLNTATSIVIESRHSWIQASHFDVDPRLVFNCDVLALWAVFVKRLAIVNQAPAGFQLAGAKCADLGHSLCAAFTATQILSSDAARYWTSDDGQSSKNRPDSNRNWQRHNSPILLLGVTS